jgi:hypothetical protein
MTRFAVRSSAMLHAARMQPGTYAERLQRLRRCAQQTEPPQLTVGVIDRLLPAGLLVSGSGQLHGVGAAGYCADSACRLGPLTVYVLIASFCLASTLRIEKGDEPWMLLLLYFRSKRY